MEFHGQRQGQTSRLLWSPLTVGLRVASARLAALLNRCAGLLDRLWRRLEVTVRKGDTKKRTWTAIFLLTEALKPIIISNFHIFLRNMNVPINVRFCFEHNAKYTLPEP